MKTYLDCIPCFIRQSLDSIRRVTLDEAATEQLLRTVLHAASIMDLKESPPVMAQQIHRLIRDLTGNNDPYREAKDQANQLALDMYPQLKERVASSEKPLETALRLAIGGNVIDLGAKSNLSEIDIPKALDDALHAPLNGNFEEFSSTVAKADNILYLADNAGEIVLDRLLIEELLRQAPKLKLTVAVRGFPVINDATMLDAEAVGLTELVEVIDNGSDVPGTVLKQCSEDFQRRFDQAEVVIAKGQGNYETLSDEQKGVFFALKAKCPVIAKDLNCQVGELILQKATSMAAVLKKD